MAARKTAVPAEEQPAPVYNMGLDVRDMKMPRLRVVGRQAKAIDLNIAKAGDLMIGQDAEDDESQIIHALNGKESLRIYVLKIHPNYACKFGGPQGQWEEGDPEMPADAKRQYNLTLFVPEHSAIMPVTYTGSGSAAGVVRGIATKLQVAGLGGVPPYETCWEMTTVINTGGTNSWPGPVFAKAEADAAEVAIAKGMHDGIVGSGQAQLASGDDTSKPAL